MDAAACTLDSLTGESPGGLSVELERRLETQLHLHLGFVWRCLRRLGVAAQDADDAAQRVFIVFAKRLASVEPGRERAFLFATAVRIAANARRKIDRAPNQHDAQLDELCSDMGDPEWLLERRRARALLDVLLEELPEAQRAVFVLLEIEELTKAEVASALGIPEGTVASRIRRARAYLGRRLEELGNSQRGGERS